MEFEKYIAMLLEQKYESGPLEAESAMHVEEYERVLSQAYYTW